MLRMSSSLSDRVRQAEADRDEIVRRIELMTSAAVSLFVTRNNARSPTTLLDGVTFTMSPNRKFTCEYAWQTSCQREASPRALA